MTSFYIRVGTERYVFPLTDSFESFKENISKFYGLQHFSIKYFPSANNPVEVTNQDNFVKARDFIIQHNTYLHIQDMKIENQLVFLNNIPLVVSEIKETVTSNENQTIVLEQYEFNKHDNQLTDADKIMRTKSSVINSNQFHDKIYEPFPNRKLIPDNNINSSQIIESVYPEEKKDFRKLNTTEHQKAISANYPYNNSAKKNYPAQKIDLKVQENESRREYDETKSDYNESTCINSRKTGSKHAKINKNSINERAILNNERAYEQNIIANNIIDELEKSARNAMDGPYPYVDESYYNSKDLINNNPPSQHISRNSILRLYRDDSLSISIVNII